jgi:hypothetical protein
VINDLVVWEFDGDEETIRHVANQIAKALTISYNMGNFGPDAFNFKKKLEEE